MDIDKLRYFIAIADYGTFSSAAKALHISQPTLSRQLIQLEKELNTQLFNRGKRHTVLTESGLYLKRRAEEILSLMDKTKSDLTEHLSILSGKIVIGCIGSKATDELAQSIYTFQQKHPLVHFEILTASSDVIKERVNNGTLDIGLIIQDSDISNYDHLTVHSTDSFGLLMPKEHPLASKKDITTEDIKTVPLSLPIRTEVLHRLNEWGQMDLTELNVVVRHDLVTSVLALVANGFCAAITYDLPLSTDSKCFTWVPLTPNLENKVALIWKHTQSYSLTVKEFIGMLIQIYKV